MGGIEDLVRGQNVLDSNAAIKISLEPKPWAESWMPLENLWIRRILFVWAFPPDIFWILFLCFYGTSVYVNMYIYVCICVPYGFPFCYSDLGKDIETIARRAGWWYRHYGLNLRLSLRVLYVKGLIGSWWVLFVCVVGEWVSLCGPGWPRGTTLNTKSHITLLPQGWD